MITPKYKVGDTLVEKGTASPRRFRIDAIAAGNFAYWIMRLSGFEMNGHPMLVHFGWVEQDWHMLESSPPKIRNPFFVRRPSV
jgi:hypothetical protein